MSHRLKKIISYIILYAFLLFLTVICVLPFYSMIISATHTGADLAKGLVVLPGKAFFGNYERLLRTTDIWRWFFNSFFIALPSTMLSAYFGALTAYGFAKFRFKGRGILYMVVLSTMMIPGQVTLIGLFQISKMYGLLNTYVPLVAPAIISGTSVFWMRSAIESTIDDAYIEAARIDSYGEFMIFNKIIIPLVKPAIATISIINFIGVWNNYMGPLIMLNSDRKYPLALGIAILKGMESQDLGVIYMGVAISIVPIMIVFSLLSKHIIGGLTVGGVKG